MTTVKPFASNLAETNNYKHILPKTVACRGEVSRANNQQSRGCVMKNVPCSCCETRADMSERMLGMIRTVNIDNDKAAADTVDHAVPRHTPDSTDPLIIAAKRKILGTFGWRFGLVVTRWP